MWYRAALLVVRQLAADGSSRSSAMSDRALTTPTHSLLRQSGQPFEPLSPTLH
ncbi:hypothetical protein HYPSUDRAFT_50087 [Hypholoma sublateritium FD-334 SS-4]|uniref:Uncharacterized protein n=1 Tax=Hypholoma sublateritium (strain FD-334 SS-4) TaxID=945553 RepID=A0A0D2NW87_HYPSF|nr:hypothetical protein HYPSUDRAFT_50100 [Hypholoma sublateritium FD-334 SS-4]KJA12821.1 hypothetical protein HYPSUDRAFT_50087 [Hypholoma sublateritium FD-334 SS-4]